MMPILVKGEYGIRSKTKANIYGRLWAVQEPMGEHGLWYTEPFHWLASPGEAVSYSLYM